MIKSGVVGEDVTSRFMTLRESFYEYENPGNRSSFGAQGWKLKTLLFFFTSLFCLSVQPIRASTQISGNGLRLVEALRTNDLQRAAVLSKLFLDVSIKDKGDSQEITSILFAWWNSVQPTTGRPIKDPPRWSEALEVKASERLPSLEIRQKFLAEVFIHRIKKSNWSSMFHHVLRLIDENSSSGKIREDLQLQVLRGALEKIDLTQDHLVSALDSAIFFRAYSALEYLVESEKIRWSSITGRRFSEPPEILASRGGDIRLLEIILRYPDFNVHSSSFSGRQPIGTVISGGHLKALQLLINHPSFKKEKDVHLRTGENALHISAATNRPEIALFLIEEHGYDLASRDAFGFSPVSRAIEQGSGEWIYRLLKNGYELDFSEKNDEGLTAIELAVDLKNTKGLRFLIESDLDPEVKEKVRSQLAPLLSQLLEKTKIRGKDGHDQFLFEKLILLEDLYESVSRMIYEKGDWSSDLSWE